MDSKKISEIREIAIESGYHDIRYLGKWKEFEVVEPIYTDDIVRYTGYPQYILVKDGKIRWTDDNEESLSIMKVLG